MPSKRTNDSVDRILEELNRRQAEDSVRSGATDQQVNDILKSLGMDDDVRSTPVNPNTIRLGPISQNSLPEVEVGPAGGGYAFSNDADPDAIIRELERQQQELAGLSGTPEDNRPARPAKPAPRAETVLRPEKTPEPRQESAPSAQPSRPSAAPAQQAEDTTNTGEIKKFLRQVSGDGQDTTVIRKRQAQFKDFFGESIAVVPDENGKLPPEKKPRRHWFGSRAQQEGESGENTDEFVPINVSMSLPKKEKPQPEPQPGPAEEPPAREEETAAPERTVYTASGHREKPKKGWFAGLFGGKPQEEKTEPEEDFFDNGDSLPEEDAAEPRPEKSAIRWEEPEENEAPVQVSDDTLNTLSSLSAINKAMEAERAARRRGSLPEQEEPAQSAPVTQPEPERPAKPTARKKRDTVEFTPGKKPRAPKTEEQPTRAYEPVGEPVMSSDASLKPKPEPQPEPRPAPVSGDTSGSFSVHMEAITPDMLRTRRPAQPQPEPRPAQEPEQKASYAEERDGAATAAFAARLGDEDAAPDTAQFVNGIAQNIISGTAQTPRQPGKYETAAHLLIDGDGEDALPEQEPRHKKAKKPALGVKLGGTPADEETESGTPPFEESAAAAHHEHDYEKTEDAPAVHAELDKKVLLHTVAAIVSGAVALVLLYLGTAAGSRTISLPAPLDPLVAPGALLGVCLVLLAVACGVCWQTMALGLRGLFTSPTADTMPALAGTGALLQLAVFLLKPEWYAPNSYFLFAGPAALVLCFNAIGKALDARTVRDSFDIVSAGVDHAAAYRLKDASVVHTVTRGLGESKPCVMVSRPTVLLKGFLTDSYSHRTSDKLQQQSARLVGVCALVALLFNLLWTKDAAKAVSAMAGVLCLAAPLAGTLMSALPAQRMQQSAARVGAVIPGWKDIRQLGRANVIQVTSRDLFPAGCVELGGIRTIRKERIDMAIVYAASILVKGSVTLRDVFLGMLGGNSKLLHQVDDLKSLPGKGFVAWVDGSRMLVGNRRLMEEYGVQTPPMEYEQRMTGSANRKAIYLAASGNLVGMFIVGYARDEDTALVLESLRRRGMSLIVTSDDFNCDAALIESVYSLPAGTVKVLTAEEMDALAPATAWLPESEGCMVHLGSFVSFVGGMQAAAGAAEAEHRSSTMLAASVLVSCLFSLIVTFTGGIATLPLPAVVLYQAAWCVLALFFPLIQKY